MNKKLTILSCLFIFFLAADTFAQKKKKDKKDKKDKKKKDKDKEKELD